MRVVHLTTTISGGAGRAAVRSVDALNLYGAEATLINRDSELDSLKVDSRLRHLIISKTSSIITGIQSKAIQKSAELMTPLSMDILTFSKSKMDFLKQYDIIHMHAFFNFFLVRKLQSVLPSIPKVMTLHDERLLTGGCHYTTGCRKLEETCDKCPKSRVLARPIVRASKERDSIFWDSDQAKSIKLVLPSLWLQGQVHRVPQFKNVSTSVVNNCVPEKFFSLEKLSQKDKQKKLRIGFVSTEINSPYKGFKFFKEAIDFFAHAQKMNVEVVLVSSERIGLEPSSRLEWRQESPVDDREFIELIDSLDVVCVPSLIDNSPNVVIEALARGKPVLASNSGGAGEIPSKLALPTFVFGDINSFCSSLQKLIEIGPLSRAQKEKVRELISEKTHAKNLINIYSSLI
jgi:glycosyltransferase involved in cell wall biosynthesis